MPLPLPQPNSGANAKSLLLFLTPVRILVCSSSYAGTLRTHRLLRMMSQVRARSVAIGSVRTNNEIKPLAPLPNTKRVHFSHYAHTLHKLVRT